MVAMARFFEEESEMAQGRENAFRIKACLAVGVCVVCSLATLALMERRIGICKRLLRTG